MIIPDKDKNNTEAHIDENTLVIELAVHMGRWKCPVTIYFTGSWNQILMDTDKLS